MWGATYIFTITSPERMISIHAPRVGSDGSHHRAVSEYGGFQSTLPVWGATILCGSADKFTGISIHAPRVGSDDLDNLKTEVERLFQSTLPVWGATRLLPVMPLPSKFQSTLPVWGATHGPIFQSIFGSISIHAPRVGSDISALRMLLSKEHFNPRSPCGERPETG